MEKIDNQKAKRLEKVFTSMGQAGRTGIAGQMNQMFLGLAGAVPGFSVLNTLLKVFEPVLSVINALFSAFIGKLQVALMPIMKIILDLLLQFLPIIDAIFKVAMPFLEIFLIPLRVILALLSPIIKLIAPLFEILYAVISPFLPVLELLANAFITFINVIIDAINLALNAATLGFWPDIPRVEPVSFQVGTPYVPRTGYYMLHEGEEVKTKAETDLARYRQEYLMERTAAGIEKLVLMKEERY